MPQTRLLTFFCNFGDFHWMGAMNGLRCSRFLPEAPMIRLKLTTAAALLIALATIPDQAQARRYAHHGYGYGLPYPISYSHNYGPGYTPGTFAYYDGPSTNFCRQGSAAYRAQGGRYPCF
jgi:hypothetical protein